MSERLNDTKGRCIDLCVLLVVVAIPLSLLALSPFGLFPWSSVNCWQDDIDINSGRIRHTQFLLWMPVSRSVQDSALTNALFPEERTGSGANWHPVVTVSPGLHHSPHYQFGGTITQIQDLEICWEVGKMTPAARRETARHVLGLWQQTGNYGRAGEYIQSVWERAREAEKKEKVIDVGELPVP